MLKRFLTEQEEHILRAEKAEVLALRAPLAQLDASAVDLATLDRALLQLDELCLLVVVGEFNAGKSALINALVGRRFLAEGVTPTTTRLSILKYGKEAGESAPEAGDLAVITYPVDWLQHINVVDTPGTNAIIQRHQQLTEDFVPRADLILFVTSADRPFSESERIFLQRIKEWGKKVLVVVNKIDILEGPADVEQVAAFVETNAYELLGRRPSVFPISARLARQAKESLDAEERDRLWAASRFEPLERYILQALDERARVKLKLASPLGVAQRLATRYFELAEGRRALLRDDLSTLRTIEDQLGAYEADMRRDFKYHLSHVDNALYAMSERGMRFFDETIRLPRIFDLLNADKIRGMFEREVVANAVAQVEAHTLELVDWLIQQDFRQWQAVMEYLTRRIARYEGQIVGTVNSAFEYNRQALLQSVGKAAREIVGSYDKEAEAKALAESVRLAIAQTALVEVGAIGLGALLAKILATTLADVSGVLAASALVALGFYLIPYKRQKAKKDLQARVADLRQRLSEALTTTFESELTHSLARIRDATRPYTRFIDTQQATLDNSQAALRGAQTRLAELAAAIEAAGDAS
jgi:small GTP-binding protein